MDEVCPRKPNIARTCTEFAPSGPGRHRNTEGNSKFPPPTKSREELVDRRLILSLQNAFQRFIQVERLQVNATP
jgi:hypothetical protein